MSIQSKISRLAEESNTEAKHEMLAAALVSSFAWPADDEEMERPVGWILLGGHREGWRGPGSSDSGFWIPLAVSGGSHVNKGTM